MARRFKNFVSIFLLLSKLFTLFFIYINSYLVAGGGLDSAETHSAFTLVIPLFTVYLSVIFKDMLTKVYIKVEDESSKKNKKAKPEYKLKSIVKWFTYILLPLYVIAIIMVINKTAAGTFTITDMQWSLGLIEGGLGIYIGQIIFAVFKPEEEVTKK